jgi:hypothetical protein
LAFFYIIMTKTRTSSPVLAASTSAARKHKSLADQQVLFVASNPRIKSPLFPSFSLPLARIVDLDSPGSIRFLPSWCDDAFIPAFKTAIPPFCDSCGLSSSCFDTFLGLLLLDSPRLNSTSSQSKHLEFFEHTLLDLPTSRIEIRSRLSTVNLPSHVCISFQFCSQFHLLFDDVMSALAASTDAVSFPHRRCPLLPSMLHCQLYATHLALVILQLVTLLPV